MFVGHYGPAFALKAVSKSVPLWVLFLAAQWVDVIWALLVLAGVEKVRVVSGFFGLSPLDLYYMPFTHGLPSSILLSLLFGGLVAFFFRTQRFAVVFAVAVASFSHWVGDLIVHRPDLPLWQDEFKVGFGLWHDPMISVPLELGILCGGLWMYDRALPSPTRSGQIALWVFGLVLAALQIYNTFLAVHPENAEAFAQTALIAFFAIAALAGLVDYLRRNSTPASR